MKEKTYTAPAVIACTDVVHSTKQTGEPVEDGDIGFDVTAGGVGFYL